jgi:hypothetical protein
MLHWWGEVQHEVKQMLIMNLLSAQGAAAPVLLASAAAAAAAAAAQGQFCSTRRAFV